MTGETEYRPDVEAEVVALPCGWAGPRLRMLDTPDEETLRICQALVGLSSRSDQELAAHFGVSSSLVGLWRVGAFLPPTEAFVDLLRLGGRTAVDALLGIL